MGKKRTLTLRAKIFLLAGISTMVIVITILGYQSWQAIERENETIKETQAAEMTSVKSELKDYVSLAYQVVESAYNNTKDKKYLEEQYGTRLKGVIDIAESVINSNMEKVRLRQMTVAQAKRNSIEQIKRMRYDSGTGYVWINDTGKPYPKMIMHPTVPALDGEILNDPKYDCTIGDGRNLFVAMVEICGKEGEGFVEYMWPKPKPNGLSEDQPKISYVRGIKAWNWIIGTGVYMDDAIRDAQMDSISLIKNIRYHDGTGYFRITDTAKPYPLMVMDPLSPVLDGQILSNETYNCTTDKKNLFSASVELAEQNGDGYLENAWPKTADGGIPEEKPQLTYVKLFKPWNWVISTGIFIDEIQEQMVEKQKVMKLNLVKSLGVSAVIALVLLFVVILFFRIVLNSILDPIEGIVKWSHKLAGFDLRERISQKGSDEIGKLTQNLNGAVATLSDLVVKMKGASQGTMNIKKEVEHKTLNSVSILSGIVKNIELIKTQISGLDKNIEKSSVTMGSISSNISILDGHIDEQASAVEESTASIEEMIASLKNVAQITQSKKAATQGLVKTARKGGEKLESTNELIAEVQSSVGEILEMITIINNIASQTNLLSMNAAIEAAHAGELGKGFAVVADEIRNLAESSSENAKSISVVLKDIVDKVKRASDSSGEMNAAFSDIDKGITEVDYALSEIASNAEELSAGSEQILKAVTSLNEVSLRVKDGSSEMKNASASIDSLQGEVRSISSQVLSGIVQVSDETNNIDKSMKEVSEFVDRLGESTESLNEEVNKFKTE